MRNISQLVTIGSPVLLFLFLAGSGVAWELPRLPGPGLLPPEPTVSSPTRGVILPGTIIRAGEMLPSYSYNHALAMQTDGHLVYYRANPDRRIPWVPVAASGTAGRPVALAAMQTDGNFVLYDAFWRPIFSSHTEGWPGAVMVLQDDGRAVIYHGRLPLWALGDRAWRVLDPPLPR